MRFWIREVVGWVLMLLGLLVFYLSYELLLARRMIEAGPLTLIGFFIFRGGIHLLKVAAAAQICLHLQRQLEQAGDAKPRTTQIKRF